ncbi:MAG: TRAP transporter small permease, partial [Myxococcales bacterium]
MPSAELAQSQSPAASHVAGAPEAPGEKPGGTAVERWALVVIVLAMVILPTIEAAWRRLTGSSVPGAAVYTEHLTLWVGFIGALLATATGHHLALSTVDLLPERVRPWARAFGSAITTLVSAILAFASFDMLLADKGRVDTLAGGVPEWWFEIIMPVGFAVMAGRAAWMAPFKKARIFCAAILVAVLPFVVSRAFGRGAGLAMPDGPTLLRGHTALLSWPGSIL